MRRCSWIDNTKFFTRVCHLCWQDLELGLGAHKNRSIKRIRFVALQPATTLSHGHNGLADRCFYLRELTTPHTDLSESVVKRPVLCHTYMHERRGLVT